MPIFFHQYLLLNSTKSSGEKNSKEITEDALVPGLFVEKENDNGFTFGFEYNPGEAELGSGTGSDDDAETDDDRLEFHVDDLEAV